MQQLQFPCPRTILWQLLTSRHRPYEKFWWRLMFLEWFCPNMKLDKRFWQIVRLDCFFPRGCSRNCFWLWRLQLGWFDEHNMRACFGSSTTFLCWRFHFRKWSYPLNRYQSMGYRMVCVKWYQDMNPKRYGKCCIVNELSSNEHQCIYRLCIHQWFLWNNA